MPGDPPSGSKVWEVGFGELNAAIVDTQIDFAEFL